MAKHPVIWYVVADGTRARFLMRRKEASGYEVMAEIEAPEARAPSQALVSDRPGRAQESANPARHALEPRSDRHRALKTDFAREVAAKLNGAGAEGAFDALVIYAAPRSLATLREALDAATRSKIKAEFPKDLTNVPLSDLPQHLEAGS